MRCLRILAACGLLVFSSIASVIAADVDTVLKRIGTKRGIVALIGLPDNSAESIIQLANASELKLYFQSADPKQVSAVREAAHSAGLLGRQIFVDSGSLKSIHLGDNVADCILVAPSVKSQVTERELLRALRPKAAAYLGDRKIVKAVPAGIDEWSHPYHGPDNNPQSTDQLARGEFRTQFMADPKFSPMPEQSVIAGGRIFKAMGHIAHKANQNPMLNKLLGINAYNGTILWKRDLSPGFMIHRNTMIATDDALYMGDHESCKVFDASTGKLLDQITVPKEITDGPVWKWMAMRNGILYGLVGNPEIKVDTQRSARRGLGHWPWGMWKGHDYKDPRTAFGFGRTLVAIDLKTKKILWHYRDNEFLDARAICMNKDHILCFTAEKFLACIDVNTGSLLWKNSDADLLEAIGPNSRAQHYITGYATTCYMKCSEDYVFFAGPQRKKLVVASAKDGKLAWTHPDGNLQLVLRDDAIFAAGPKTTGLRLDYATGKKLGSLPTRRACTRATGCLDSVFYRTSGGTVRVVTETNNAQHIAPMRPPCQDGVLISNGNLYWGPWMCGCQLSLYGNICLSPAKLALENDSYKNALVQSKNFSIVKPLKATKTDWVSYRSNNARTDSTSNAIPGKVKLEWKFDVTSNELPTAPVVAGGLVFIADRTGVVRALTDDGQEVWKSYTAGAVYYPPAIAHDRVYVGSADGRVYSFEARTGRLLWTFRVAPYDRLIPVFDKLISTWPVAGGVVVEGDTVYAAAGIAHYDGTYVVALDAISGELKQKNSTSGVLSAQANSGVSMQGNPTIVDGELRFLAGGVYETARYDLTTLKCLNTPRHQVTSQYRTAFYPYYPSYGKYLSLDHTCSNGSLLCHDASYEGSLFANLALQEAWPAEVKKPTKQASRYNLRRGKKEFIPKELWKDKTSRRFTSFVVSGNDLLATGHPDKTPAKTFLAAINVEDGSDTWLQELPAEAVKGGTAVDGRGRIYVALENGQLLCFGPG